MTSPITNASLARSAPHTRTVQGKSSSRRLQRIRRPGRVSSATQQRRGSANSQLFHRPLIDESDDASQFQFSIDPSHYNPNINNTTNNNPAVSEEMTIDDDSIYYDSSKRQLPVPPPPTTTTPVIQEDDDLEFVLMQRQQSRVRRMMVAGTDNSIPTLLQIGDSKRLTNVSTMTMQVELLEHDETAADPVGSSLTLGPDDHNNNGPPPPLQHVIPRHSQFSMDCGAKGVSALSMDDTSATDPEDDPFYEEPPTPLALKHVSSRRLATAAPATIPEDQALSNSDHERHQQQTLLQQQQQQQQQQQKKSKKPILGRLWKAMFTNNTNKPPSSTTRNHQKKKLLRQSAPVSSAPSRNLFGLGDEAAVTVQQVQTQRPRPRTRSVPTTTNGSKQILRVPRSQLPSPGATLHLSATGVPVWQNESGRILPFTSSEC